MAKTFLISKNIDKHKACFVKARLRLDATQDENSMVYIE